MTHMLPDGVNTSNVYRSNPSVHRESFLLGLIGIAGFVFSQYIWFVISFLVMDRQQMREQFKERYKGRFHDYHKNCPNHRNGQIWFGLFIIIAGVLLLLSRLGYDIPSWIFTWKMLLIAIGLFIGIINRFRDAAWAIFMIVGGAFLLKDLGFWSIDIGRFILPGVFILVGVMVLFSRAFKKKRMQKDFEQQTEPAEISSQDDFLDATSVFGGYKTNVFSKNFKGGDLTAIFGGNEINLTNADFTGTARIDVVQIFGGTKLIIPANWTVKTEMVSVFGGLDDKRGMAPAEPSSEKILIIDGVSIFGGIEIKNF